MKVIEIDFPGQEESFLTATAIEQSREFIVSPIFPGNLYEITRLVDPSGRVFALKTLRETVVTKYPQRYTFEDIFAIHRGEHAFFLKHMAEFVVPTCFYVEEKNQGIQYRVLQPWIHYGIQFKEAVRNERLVPLDQLPSLDERLRFIYQFTQLLNDPLVYPRIADVDFFLVPNNGSTNIRLIDTNFLWHPKHHTDGRRIHQDLREFLFTPHERHTATVMDTFHDLGDALHMNQLD